MTNILAKFKRASDLFEKRQNGSKTSRLPCSNPKSRKCQPTQPLLMLKITILGLVLVAIALSGTVSVASAETVPSPLQQVRDGVPIGEIVCSNDRALILSPSGIPACVFEESVLELETRGFGFVGEPFDMFPIKSTDNHGPPSAPRIGIPPVVSMSRLPNIGETAVVEITFTNNLAINITDTMNADLHSTGWRISSAFEIVDSGGLQYEIENMGEDNPTMAQYTAFTPLDSGESITYRIEVRAVSEGHAFVVGVGYSHSGESIRLYIDSEETLLYEDHWAKYPEMHQRPASPRHDGQPPENTEKIYIPYADPTRDEFWEWFVSHHTHANPRIAPIDALNFVYRAGVHLNLTATDVRQLLSDGGYNDTEIDDALSQHPFTQPSDMSGLDGDGDAAYTIPSSVADASNAFALNFYRQVSGDDENIFFSPISMYTAFSVLYEGAEGDTAVQIRDAFGLEEHPTARHKAVSDTMSSLNRDDPYATVEMANSLWIADRFEPYDSYINTARDTYLASVEIVDFLDKTEDGAVDRINAWASEKTHGKIPQVLLHDDVNERTVATILNAIYFKGSWVTEFPKDATHESDFWTGTDTARADFMNIVADFEYYDNDSVQILKLPYKGDRLSMLIFLPSERDGMSSFEQMITPDIIKEWKEQMFSTEVQVSIPKIEVRTHYDLKEPLGNLGVLDAFDPYTASLSGIANLTKTGNLYVDKAVHDAYLKINEEGTEAAAVTSIIVRDLSLPVREEFVADHPFLFVIQDDESDTFLFIGKILNPQK